MKFSVDLRHEQDERVLELESAVKQECFDIATADRTAFTFDKTWDSPAIQSYQDDNDCVKKSADAEGLSWRSIRSGAVRRA